jgi:hypothetical protein
LTKKTYHNDAVVTDIKVYGILGLDFLKANSCTIDMSNEVLNINGKDIRMSIEGSLGCFRITAVETVSIPPRSEVVDDNLETFRSGRKKLQVGSKIMFTSMRSTVGRDNHL